jgi:predicted dehydrogenase
MRTFNKIKSLVIGLGNIGLNYDIVKKKEITTHCKALSLDKSYELIGAIDKDINKTRIFNKIYNKPGFKSVEKALKFIKPELIVISCNTEYHYNIFEKIKKFQNLKYILLEKPGKLNLPDLKKIFVFCKKKKNKNLYKLFQTI